MKKLVFFLCVAVCAACVWTACSDDDDHPKKLTVDDIVGTYTGNLEMLGSTVPNTSVILSKVDANKAKVELKDFAFGGLTFGGISAECILTHDGDDLDLNGTTTLVVEALGNASLPVVITGDANGTLLDLDIQVSGIPGIGALEVDFEGRK